VGKKNFSYHNISLKQELPWLLLTILTHCL